MNSAFATFWGELKSRNVRKTMTIYFSSALTTIGVIKLLIDVYAINTLERIFPVVVTLLLSGLVSAFIFAWFHGSEGTQGFQKKEIFLHSMVMLVAAIISFRVGSAPQHLPHFAGKSVAVLPFENMSGSKDDEYFSDGIMEDILTQLSKIADLNVISRTSTMKYKNTVKTIREISDELNVTAVLEGSVRRIGNRVRITGNLTDAKTERHIWAETYDRDIQDIFAIQSEVAQTIAAALKAKLSPEEKTLIEKKATGNLEAYAYYLRGRDFYYRYKKEDNEEAIAFFKKALALDSAYANAYAGLGDAYCQRMQKFEFSPNWADSAIEVSAKAIRLDPTLAEGYKALGLAYDAKGWKRKALELYYASVKLNPNYAPAIANLGTLQQYFGNLDEALKWLKKSVAVSPERAYQYVGVALVYQILQMDSAAFQWYDKAATLDPDNPYILIQRGWLHLFRGEMQQAREIATKALTIAPDWDLGYDYAADVEVFSGNYAKAKTLYDTLAARGVAESRYQLVYVLQKLGMNKQAEELSNRLLREYEQKSENELAGLVVEIGYLHTMRNELSEANTWFRKAFDTGLRDVRWLQVDPRLENIRNDPEFQHTLSDMKAKGEEMKQRIIAQGL